MKVAGLLLLGGCFGLLAGHGPGPTGPADPPVECSSLVWPAIDGVIAATFTYGVETCHDEMCGLGDLGAIPVAVIAALSATYGLVVDVTCDKAAADQARFQGELANTREQAAEREREQTAIREQAWQLMQPAATAARAGVCTTVSRVDAQIRALDDDFHSAVFVRDVAIARCLAPVTSPAASSSPSP